jgi:hypothetical protein
VQAKSIRRESAVVTKVECTRAFLKDDYVRRAAGTQLGIGANSKEEALYPIYEKDSRGQPFDGASHRSVLRYPASNFPPVNAFWSLTMYDVPGQLLVKYPINRYLINSPMLSNLKRDADGGLTVYIQNESPGPEQGDELAAVAQGPVHDGSSLLLAEARIAGGKVAVARRAARRLGNPRRDTG